MCRIEYHIIKVTDMYAELIMKGFFMILFLSLTRAMEDYKSSEMDVYKPFPFRCNQYIHFNSSGKMKLKTCPSGTHFSPTEMKCIDKKLAGCGLLPRSKRDTCPPDPTCTIYDNAVKKTYPTDCNKYTYCEASSISIRSCSVGQHFSPTEKICMSIATANCPYCGPEPSTTTQSPVSTTVLSTTAGMTTTVNVTTTTTPPPPTCEPTPSCSIFEVEIKKVYPPDCKKYVKCDTGIKSIVSCNDGFEFSPTQKICMSANFAGCTYCVESTPVAPSVTTTQVPTTLFTTTSTTGTPTTTLPVCAPIPTCMSETGILKPYPPDCSKYIYCSAQNEAKVRVCETGLHFLESYQGCVDPTEANCLLCSA